MRIWTMTAISAALLATAAQAQLVRSGSGAGTAPARDQFRTDVGGGVVAGANGSFGGVRREINWDGVPDARSAPNPLPADFFNVNSPRGAVFSTPGTGFEVSGNAGVAPIQFDDINPNYSSLFTTFSAQRLFTAIGSNILDVSFFRPGTTTPAATSGFGAVFTDVDLAATTSIELFDLANNSLGVFFVPNVAGANESLSFLGVSYATSIITRVRITSGNAALAAGVDETAVLDLVAMDDFLYAEPLAVPEPASWALMIAGFGGVGAVARRRRRLAAVG